MRRFVQAFAAEDAFAPGLPADVAEAFAAAPAHFNIGKDAQACVWAAGSDDPAWVAPMHWGLVPRWSKEPSTPYTTVTARVDRAARSRLFGDAWKHRHCIVPLTGYFKWDRQRRRPWPMYVQRADGLALLAAGLWERWRDADSDEPRDAFTLLTHADAHIPAPLSPDGPVFLDPSAAGAWLLGKRMTAADLLAQAQTPDLEAYYVAAAVADPRRDDYTLLDPVEPPVNDDDDDAVSSDDSAEDD
ncbi:SOS response-associated peptidase family protein [Stenotrophomonas sp. ZAC14D2_NAIMI4_6]|uniref:SOS response-associated peptidase n=1 Tax=Stenotrophomonas sp. ZAC14D2_NAIMI4_6 TaxID=2072406 RepID=UPI000D541D9A|nr:SOS response-associated peptidase family protein [Stenotrophomonas sp. ZAC14D2_NAIMI4_6]AWH21836.1 hypothetical protein C1933_11780 [Stenotrophomonas sp. ZAC14D2_NAIMI4_6]